MTLNQKTEIQAALAAHVERFPSAATAVAALEGVSQATQISVRDGKWKNISDQMWRNIGAQVGWKAGNRQATDLVETRDAQTLCYYYDLAKSEGETFSLIGGSGFGKTFTGKWYAQQHTGQNVYYLECAEYWTAKIFLTELLRAMGRPAAGLSIYEMMETIMAETRRQESPLLILDEVDKLDDKSLRFFITLYNKLAGQCGIVWTATDNIARRIQRGLRLGKMGYEEINTRIGSNHIALKGTSREELAAICHSRGITDEETVSHIFNTYGGNLRRVNREILKAKVANLKG